VAATFGLAFPAFHGRRHQFLVANSAYGATPFSFRWRAGDYYAAYLGAGLVLLVGFCAVFALVAAGTSGGQAGGQLGGVAGFVGGAAAYFAALTWIQARTTNLLYRCGSLPGLSFGSHLRARELLALYAGNALAVALSFGLLIPWAQIRLARYRAEHTEVFATADLGGFARAAEEAERLGAFADEAAVAFDFDFGL
jgi:uncharacterized membrane protein YjgN (DUF898 family)